MIPALYVQQQQQQQQQQHQDSRNSWDVAVRANIRQTSQREGLYWLLLLLLLLLVFILLLLLLLQGLRCRGTDPHALQRSIEPFLFLGNMLLLQPQQRDMVP